MKPSHHTVLPVSRLPLRPYMFGALKGHSYKNVCEIIALNDRLDPN
jgi:hypothetical protein